MKDRKAGTFSGLFSGKKKKEYCVMQVLSVDTLRFRYFAYNCLEIRTPDGKYILIDPCLKKEGRYACGYDVQTLEGCDYVFINHSHMDHVASLGEVYDRFRPAVFAHGETVFELAQLFDIPYIKMVPFEEGAFFDLDSFSVRVLPGRHNPAAMFMVRPSGRIDETANDKFVKEHLSGLNERETVLENKGSVFNSNFLITLRNNFKIGFFAGNPGMIDPADRNLWEGLKPDIVFAHRAPVKYENWAGRMANILDVTGARILFPIHIDDAFLANTDPRAYADAINSVCRERKIEGRALIPERGKWYSIVTQLLREEP